MPFEKGQSGNPAGRPRGAPDRRALIRSLLLPHAPDLIEKAVELALQGDSVILKACIDKLIPNARESARVKLGDFKKEGHGGELLLSKVAVGELSLEDAKAFMSLLESNARLTQQSEFMERLTALEEVHEKPREPT
jgi:hypothetical protein